MKMTFRMAIALSCLTCAWAVTPVISDEVTNPISRFEIIVDGRFTNGVPLPIGGFNGEWGDVLPLWFIAPQAETGTLFQTTPGDPNANSLLYVVIAPGAGEPIEDLYLMYDYLDRTSANFMPGEFIADVRFPVNLPNSIPSNLGGGGRRDITVQFRGAQLNGIEGIGPTNGDSFFDVFVDLNTDGISDGKPEQFGLGIEGAIDFAPSALRNTNHMLIELEVSLRIPPNFGPGFPGNGINPATGLYDPNPAFWGAAAAKDVGDPPISAAIFTINPNGSTTANSNFLPFPQQIPEPSTILLLGCGVIALLACSRRRKS